MSQVAIEHDGDELINASDLSSLAATDNWVNSTFTHSQAGYLLRRHPDGTPYSPTEGLKLTRDHYKIFIREMLMDGATVAELMSVLGVAARHYREMKLL